VGGAVHEVRGRLGMCSTCDQPLVLVDGKPHEDLVFHISRDADGRVVITPHRPDCPVVSHAV